MFLHQTYIDNYCETRTGCSLEPMQPICTLLLQCTVHNILRCTSLLKGGGNTCPHVISKLGVSGFVKKIKMVNKMVTTNCRSKWYQPRVVPRMVGQIVFSIIHSPTSQVVPSMTLSLFPTSQVAPSMTLSLFKRTEPVAPTLLVGICTTSY